MTRHDIEQRAKDHVAIIRLTWERDLVRDKFYAHRDPGGLKPAEVEAFILEREGLEMMLKAAQLRLDAEIELQMLIRETQEIAL